jgi:ABC-2 type transport system ATP-binding protein
MHDGSGRIVANRLAKHFGPVPAVQDLSFTVQPGSVTGFLGPNGAGKTTTLRMILGLVTPNSGFATINGVGFQRLGTPGRVVGAVLDAQGFHPRRTARRHLLTYTAAMGIDDGRVDEVLGLVVLAPVSSRKPGGFSLGMRQRLALATALLGDPQVLVLDEPANGLDPEGMAWLRQFLRSFADGGRTVLISSHLLAEVQQTIDQVVIVNHGVTRYYGSLESLRASQRPRVLVQAGDPVKLAEALRGEGLTELESTPEGKLAVHDTTARRIGDVAAAAGVALYEVNEERVDLERLYFQLTGMAPAPQQQPGPQQPPGPPPGGGWGPPPGQGPYGAPPGQGYPQQGYEHGQYGPGRNA